MHAPLPIHSRRRWILAIALLLGTALASVTPRVAAQTPTQVYTNGNTLVFSDPSPTAPVVAQWSDGVPVALYGCLADRSWCQVALGPTVGWVSAPSLMVVETDRRIGVGQPGWSVPIVVFSGPAYYGGGIYIHRERGWPPPGWHRGPPHEAHHPDNRDHARDHRDDHRGPPRGHSPGSGPNPPGPQSTPIHRQDRH